MLGYLLDLGAVFGNAATGHEMNLGGNVVIAARTSHRYTFDERHVLAYLLEERRLHAVLKLRGVAGTSLDHAASGGQPIGLPYRVGHVDDQKPFRGGSGRSVTAPRAKKATEGECQASASGSSQQVPTRRGG